MKTWTRSTSSPLNCWKKERYFQRRDISRLSMIWKACNQRQKRQRNNISYWLGKNSVFTFFPESSEGEVRKEILPLPVSVSVFLFVHSLSLSLFIYLSLSLSQLFSLALTHSPISLSLSLSLARSFAISRFPSLSLALARYLSLSLCGKCRITIMKSTSVIVLVLDLAYNGLCLHGCGAKVGSSD